MAVIYEVIFRKKEYRPRNTHRENGLMILLILAILTCYIDLGSENTLLFICCYIYTYHCISNFVQKKRFIF